MESAPKQKSEERKFTLHYAILAVIFAFALILLYDGAMTYIRGRISEAVMELALGISFLLLWGISTQRLREILTLMPIVKKRFEMVTVVECSKCGFKSVRNFEQSDYIMRRVGKCPKCAKPMLISSIHLKTEPEPKQL